MTSRSLTILYGSETGCAQEVAERISRDAKRHHFRVHLSAMDEYDKSKIPNEKLIIFVCSTTGQGEAPDNMRNFWRFLRQKSLPSNCLNFLNFAVFGLGDSSYQYFNLTAKLLYRRLLQLGANPIYRRGDGDDQADGGLDEELVPWLKGLWEVLLKMYPLPENLKIIPENVLPKSKYKIITQSQSQNIPSQNTLSSTNTQLTNTQLTNTQLTNTQLANTQLANTQLANTLIQNTVSSNTLSSNTLSSLDNNSFNRKNPYMAKLIENKRITANDHFQDVRHIVLQIEEEKIKYNEGDVVAIHPKNSDESVEKLLERLELSGDEKIIITKNDEDAHDYPFLNKPITWRELFKEHLDINGCPKRYFFEILFHFAKAEHEKERLEYFISLEGTQDLYDYNQREKRTHVEVLCDFPSCKIPLDYILEIPILQPRYFSISSSQKMYKNEIHITAAIVKYKTPFKRIKNGVCTSWLAGLNPKEEIYIPIWIKKGYMKLPNLEKPLILIGPGTGVAPMRSFIQSRMYLSQNYPNLEIGKTILFFGNRHSKKDFLYENEFLKYNQSKHFQLITAFSREYENKIYVQHKMKEHSKLIYNLLMNGVYIYVSGNAKQMPKDVMDQFIEIVEQEGKLTNEEATKFIKKLKQSKRYQEETWN